MVGVDDLAFETIAESRECGALQSLLVSPMAAWAAARRATGTRNGLHET
jgi:hypothetical protein